MKIEDLRWKEVYANPDPGIYRGYSLFEIEKPINRRGSIRITFKNDTKKISVIGESEEKTMQFIFDLIDLWQNGQNIEVLITA